METVQIIDEIYRLPLTEKIRVVEIVLKNIRHETEKNAELVRRRRNYVVRLQK